MSEQALASLSDQSQGGVGWVRTGAQKKERGSLKDPASAETADRERQRQWNLGYEGEFRKIERCRCQ